MNNNMTPQEYYRKVDEVIAKFTNWKELYQRSPLFNVTVQQLVRGADPHEIIGHLIVTTEDTKKAFEQYMLRDTRPMLTKP